MSAITRTPQNTNLLQPTKFQLTFDRIKNTTFFCQTVNIPGMAGNQITVNTPAIDYYAAGNKIIYNTFNIDFLIDEDLQSWISIYDWFRSYADPTGSSTRNRLSNIQSNRKSLQTYSDATLTIYSALNNPNKRIHFINAFPISLSDINLDTKQSADNIITGSASFVFEYFEFLPT